MDRGDGEDGTPSFAVLMVPPLRVTACRASSAQATAE